MSGGFHHAEQISADEALARQLAEEEERLLQEEEEEERRRSATSPPSRPPSQSPVNTAPGEADGDGLKGIELTWCVEVGFDFLAMCVC